MAAFKKRADRVYRHRRLRRAAGVRPVQFWVPDTRGADFAERVRQQCLKLKGDPAELDALRFVEEAAAQVEGWQWSEAILSRFRCKVTTASLARPSLCSRIFWPNRSEKRLVGKDGVSEGSCGGAPNHVK